MIPSRFASDSRKSSGVVAGGLVKLRKTSSELIAGGKLLLVQIPSRYISILRVHGLSKMTVKNRNQPASTDASSQLTQNLGA